MDEGTRLLKAAREAIELSIMSPGFRQEMLADSLSGFDGRHGIFVSITHYPTESKRGHACLIESMKPLKDTILQVALDASVNERFVSISHTEFGDMTIALGIITDLKEIKNSGISTIRSELKSGIAGLAIRFGYHEGFAFVGNTEKPPMPEELLRELCDDAGLPHLSWENHNVKLYGFHAQIFVEKEPRGDIEEILL